MVTAATAASGGDGLKIKSFSAKLFADFVFEVPNLILMAFQRARMQKCSLVMEIAHQSRTTTRRRVVFKGNSALYMPFVNSSNLQVRRLPMWLAWTTLSRSRVRHANLTQLWLGLHVEVFINCSLLR